MYNNIIDEEVHFILTHLRHHIYIQREDTSTYLVYNNEVFSHEEGETNKKDFEVIYHYHGAFFTLKAVNHKHSDGSGSGMDNENFAAEGNLRDTECYLGFTSDKQSICHSSNTTETGDINWNLLFMSNCLSA